MPTLLERTVPVYHFHEVHTRWIQAAPIQVWQALSTLRLNQLTLSSPLVALRHLGTPAPSAGKPLFTTGPVRMLQTTAPTYAVGGAVARPWQLDPELGRSRRWRNSPALKSQAGRST